MKLPISRIGMESMIEYYLGILKPLDIYRAFMGFSYNVKNLEMMEMKEILDRIEKIMNNTH